MIVHVHPAPMSVAIPMRGCRASRLIHHWRLCGPAMLVLSAFHHAVIALWYPGCFENHQSYCEMHSRVTSIGATTRTNSISAAPLHFGWISGILIPFSRRPPTECFTDAPGAGATRRRAAE